MPHIFKNDEWHPEAEGFGDGTLWAGNFTSPVGQPAFPVCYVVSDPCSLQCLIHSPRVFSFAVGSLGLDCKGL